MLHILLGKGMVEASKINIPSENYRKQARNIA